jgi:hypothetical protein
VSLRPQLTTWLVLLMETLVVYALLAWLLAAIGEGGEPSLLGVAAVVFLSFGLSRALQATELPIELLRVWGSLFSILIFYAIVRADFFGDWRLWDFGWANDLFSDASASTRDRPEPVFGIPLLWLVWMRGILRGQHALSFETVLSTFAAGFLVVALVELFQAGTDDTPAAVGVLAVPFVAIGLLAIGLAHASRSDDEASRPLGGRWIAAIGGGVVVMAGLAALVSLFELEAAATAATSAADAVLYVAGRVAYYIIWPVLYFVDLVFQAIRAVILAVFGQGERPALPEGGPPEQEMRELGELPGLVDFLIRASAALLVGGVLLAVLALLFQRFRRTRRLAPARESVYQEGRLAGDLGDLLGALVDRLRPGFARGARLDPIRRLYHDMLADAASRGVEREIATTPLELAPRLEARFRSALPARITDVFDAARYGGYPPSETEVREMRREWEVLVRSVP